jgi:DNA-binding NarL/FixJ family response regulator
MAEPGVVRVLLADDHHVVRRGLRHVLDSEPDIEVVCEAGSGDEALRQALGADIDLAILDVSMPGMGGLDVARELTARRPGVRVLMLSMHDNDQYFSAARRAGACGYVLKSVVDHDLIDACRGAMRDQPFIYPRTRGVVDASGGGERVDGLTDRQREILALIAEGHTSKRIAELLVISPKTVERHREQLLARLGLRNRVELTRYAIRAGLVEP